MVAGQSITRDACVVSHDRLAIFLQPLFAAACTHFRLTPAEALRGATVHAARALGLHDRGVLRVGLRADLAVWRMREPAALCYWLGGQWLDAAYAGGRRLA